MSEGERRFSVKPGIIRSHVYEVREGTPPEEIRIERKLSFDLSYVGGAVLGLTNLLRGKNIPPGWEVGGPYVRPKSRTAELLEHQNISDRFYKR